jgi:hypothetical protein
VLCEGRLLIDALLKSLYFLYQLGSEVVQQGSTAIKDLYIRQNGRRFIDLPHDLQPFCLWSLQAKNSQYLLNLVTLYHIVVHLVRLKLVHNQLDASRCGRRFLPAEIGCREPIGDDADADKG